MIAVYGNLVLKTGKVHSDINFIYRTINCVGFLNACILILNNSSSQHYNCCVKGCFKLQDKYSIAAKVRGTDGTI